MTSPTDQPRRRMERPTRPLRTGERDRAWDIRQPLAFGTPVLGLTVSLLLIFVKFVQGTVELARQTGTEDANNTNRPKF